MARAARELLLEDGYHGLTMEAVAARAGVGKTTVYRWWPQKRDLVLEILTDLIPEASAPTGDLESDIRALVGRSVEILTGSVLGDVLTALLVESAGDPSGAQRIEDLVSPYRAANAAVLLSAAGRGHLPHDLDTSVVLDIVVGAVFYRRLMRRPIDEALVEQLIELIMNTQLPRTDHR